MKKLLGNLRQNWERLAFLPWAIIPNLDSNGRVTQIAICQTNTNQGVDVVNCTLDKLTSRATTIFFTIVTGLAIILLIWAGIQYIQASGNPDAVKAARQRIINICIGVVLLVAAYAIINFLVVIAAYLASRAH